VALISVALTVALGWAWGIVAGLGSLVGGLIAGVLYLDGYFNLGRRLTRWGVVLVCLVAMVFAASWLRSFFPASIALLVPNAVGAFAASALCVLGLGSTTRRFPGLRFLESLLVGIFFCSPLLASHGGQFTRPQWLADWVVEQNFPLAVTMSLLGLVAAVASLALQNWTSTEVTQHTKTPSRNLSALVLVLFLGAFVAWDLFWFLGPVKTQPPSNPPPVSFAGDPPPPPPPQPEPLVAIQFTSTHSPAKRLGGFYFRINDQTVPSLETPSGSAIVETKIYYLDKSIGTLSLAGHSKFQPLQPPGRRFQKADLVETKVPMVSEKSEIDEKNVRRICELDLVAQEPEPAPKEVTALMDRISSSVNGTTMAASGSFMEQIQTAIRNKPERAQSLLLRSMATIDWLEQNGDFSGGNKTQEARSISEFVNGGLKGDSADFARLAVAIFKAQGIKSRLAEGFFHPAESNMAIDRLVLTDSHRETWVEVLTAKGDWIILPIRPAKVSDREPPPPQEDLKQELFDEIEKGPAPQKNASPSALPRNSSPSILLPLALLILGGGVLWWVFRVIIDPSQRILAQASSNAHRQMLKEAGNRAAALFRPRHFGESWAAYSGSMALTLPALSKSFDKILTIHRLADDSSVKPSTCIKAYIAFAIMGSFSLERFQIGKKQPQNQPLQP
jgi:hypothetical protein